MTTTEVEVTTVPDGAAVASLLRERFAIDPAYVVNVVGRVVKGCPSVKVEISRPKTSARPREVFAIEVTQTEPPTVEWTCILDALDALVGMLVESGYSYRDLPSGAEVEHGSAKFQVDVSARRPDLDDEADRILNDAAAKV